MLPDYLTTNVNKKNSNHEPVQKIDYKSTLWAHLRFTLSIKSNRKRSSLGYKMK